MMSLLSHQTFDINHPDHQYYSLIWIASLFFVYSSVRIKRHQEHQFISSNVHSINNMKKMSLLSLPYDIRWMLIVSLPSLISLGVVAKERNVPGYQEPNSIAKLFPPYRRCSLILIIFLVKKRFGLTSQMKNRE